MPANYRIPVAAGCINLVNRLCNANLPETLGEYILPWLIFLVVLLALGLLWISTRQRKASGLPGGRLIYSDTDRWSAAEKPLYAPALGLTGKPDYLVEQDGQLIPVEVKTSSPRRGPYDAHIYQLAAYCLLVTQVYGKRPKYGIIHYKGKNQPGQTYAIDFTADLEAAVLNTLQEMQGISLRKEVNRSHDNPSRCAHCGYHHTCDQALSE